MQPINLTLGTAGHIDHGKTALVKSLTGCETDRLKEEQERGMSIDLGYAPCTIGDTQVGIVDVPGHEHFVKTMVAGASGMDGVILVVAADDGIMPQTREHLDILTLLGVTHGLVALTKIDRVDAEHRALVEADLEQYLRGTFLEHAPVLGVSNVTGAGFDAFYEALWKLVESMRPKSLDGVFRMPLDRAFSAAGHGTIVAGIPVSGSARLGDEVQLLPHGLPGQIRRIEVYGQPSDTVKAGQCAAINVRHWEHQNVGRGDCLATPGYFATGEWFVCRLRLLPYEKLLLKHNAKVKFHTGTAEVVATVHLLEGDHLTGRQEALIQVRTATPVVAGPGDRFILRSLSPVATIGGGLVVEGVDRRLRRNRPEIVDDLRQRADAVADPAQLVEYCLRTAPGLAARPAELGVRAKVLPGPVTAILARFRSDGKAMELGGGLWIHRVTADRAARQIMGLLEQYHAREPESPGMTLDELRQTSDMERTVLDALVAWMNTQGQLAERVGRLALPSHQATFRDPDARLMETLETLLRDGGFHPPAAAELAAQTGAKPADVERLLRILREHGRAVLVPEGIVFHRDAVDRARTLLVDHLRQQGRLESVDFKYLLDTTRKFALPLLDYFDRVGVTRRVGNTRFPKSV
jgi:selenocysteine-specific elongation factor